MNSYANLAPGTPAPVAGKYKCVFCGAGGIASFFASSDNSLLNKELATNLGKQQGTITSFGMGQIFTECPNCKKATGWSLIEEQPETNSQVKTDSNKTIGFLRKLLKTNTISTVYRIIVVCPDLDEPHNIGVYAKSAASKLIDNPNISSNFSPLWDECQKRNLRIFEQRLVIQEPEAIENHSLVENKLWSAFKGLGKLDKQIFLNKQVFLHIGFTQFGKDSPKYPWGVLYYFDLIK